MNKHLVKPVFISGLSGAGISSVLKSLEDFGYEVFDNFPLSHLPKLIEESNAHAKIAIGVDTRTRGFSPESLLEVVDRYDSSLVFMTCDHEHIQKRFSETRRRHPMARDQSVSLGITKEREWLEALRERADIVIDTTDTSIHDLRHILEGYFVPHPDENLTISLMSFGFKHGVPRSADIVMDVRFLKNPHWDAELKPMSGLDQAVGEYVSGDADFERFLANFKDLIQPLIPRYAQEGKSYLTIAIGCTGGRHRSVYTVEQLKKWFEEQSYSVFAEHRDLKL